MLLAAAAVLLMALTSGCGLFGSDPAPDPIKAQAVPATLVDQTTGQETPNPAWAEAPKAQQPGGFTVLEARVQASDIPPVEVDMRRMSRLELMSKDLPAGYLRIRVMVASGGSAQLTPPPHNGKPAAVVPPAGPWPEPLVERDADALEFFAVNDPVGRPGTFVFETM